MSLASCSHDCKVAGEKVRAVQHVLAGGCVHHSCRVLRSSVSGDAHEGEAFQEALAEPSDRATKRAARRAAMSTFHPPFCIEPRALGRSCWRRTSRSGLHQKGKPPAKGQSENFRGLSCREKRRLKFRQTFPSGLLQCHDAWKCHMPSRSLSCCWEDLHSKALRAASPDRSGWSPEARNRILCTVASTVDSGKLVFARSSRETSNKRRAALNWDAKGSLHTRLDLP